MDAANTGEWLVTVGTTDESFCTASERSFASGELAYAEAQSTVDCSAPSEVQKNFAGEVGDSNHCAFAVIRSRGEPPRGVRNVRSNRNSDSLIRIRFTRRCFPQRRNPVC